MNDLACVILASGFSRRFGCDKLLANMPVQNSNSSQETSQNPQTLIQRTVANYKAVFSKVHVVARQSNTALLEALEPEPVTVIMNESADIGLSQSIVTAVKQIPSDTGWLFALADMPYIKRDTIKRIVQASSSQLIVQPVHAGRTGNPVAIGQTFGSELLALTGDTGAKQLIASIPQDTVLKLDVDDAGIHQDIDIVDDFL